MLRSFHNRLAKRAAMQNAYVRRQQDLRRELLHTVSHDLRTPLTSLHGYLETLLRKSEQLSAEELRQYLQVAVRQSRRAGRLAQGLFDLAKLDAQETLPKFERFCLQELMQDVVQKFTRAANERQICLLFEFQPAISVVEADIAMIELLLSHLVDNAIRHSPPAGMVRVILDSNSDKVQVLIWNSGAEIAESLLSGLFDRDSLLRYRLGHDQIGLGLLIVKRIAQLHAGTIEVASNLESGTTFKFNLRAAGSE
jgi:signal transduction histidine kinase